MLEGFVSYSGIVDIFSFDYSMGQGVMPGVMSFEIAPQPLDRIPMYGTLEMSYGSNRFVMNNCLSDRASYQYNSSGEVVGFMAKDYRWAWHYTTITGAYNLKDMEGGDLVLSKKKSPDYRDVLGYSRRNLRELVEICLYRMGVSRNKINLKSVPDTFFPEVNWEHDNAAQALHELLNMFDLRVCPRWDGGVSIERLGYGRELGDRDLIESQGQELDPIEKPESVHFVTQPVRFNVDFELEPVGEDVDGKIYPIEELSYYSDSMEDSDPGAGFDNTMPEQDDDYNYTLAALAEKCIFKWWRIKLPSTKGGPPNEAIKKFKENWGEIKYIEQFLPLLGVQAATGIDAVEKKSFTKPPIVFGKFLDDGDLGSLSTESDKKIPWSNLDDVKINDPNDYKHVVTFSPMSLDAERGIVMFQDVITSQRSDSDAKFERPKLWLRCGCYIKDVTTCTPVRYISQKKVEPRSPAKVLTIMVNEASPYYGATDSGDNNIKDVEKIIRNYDAEIREQFRPITSEAATYIGLLAYGIDGAIREVGWSVNESGSTTHVQRNSDKSQANSVGYVRRNQILDDIIAKQKADRAEAVRLWQERQKQVKRQ